MGRRSARLGRELRAISPMFLLFLCLSLYVLPVITSWLAEIGKSIVVAIAASQPQPERPQLLWLAAGLTVAALCLLTYAAYLGRRLIQVRLERVAEVPCLPVLICTLSLQDGLSQQPGGAWTVNGTALPADIDAACDKDLAVRGFVWQQTLRAARYHVGTLRHLYLIGSETQTTGRGSGSIDSLRQAEAFFASYLPKAVTVHSLGLSVGGSAVDPEWTPDFDDILRTREVLTRAVRQCRHDDSDVMIDITGGPKPASVAAAMVTLDRHQLMFQYVGTGSRVGEIFGFKVDTATFSS